MISDWDRTEHRKSKRATSIHESALLRGLRDNFEEFLQGVWQARRLVGAIRCKAVYSLFYDSFSYVIPNTVSVSQRLNESLSWNCLKS